MSAMYHSILVSEVCNVFISWTRQLLIPLRRGGMGGGGREKFPPFKTGGGEVLDPRFSHL